MTCTLALFLGCGPSGGESDGGSNADALPSDGGVRAFCPLLERPVCQKAIDCGAAGGGINDCVSCPRPNNHVCTFGSCQEPPVLAGGELYRLLQRSGNFRGTFKLFRWQAIASETAGGATIGCTQIYDHSVDLLSPCLNIIESRRQRPDWTNAPDDFPLSMAQFPGGMHTLFVVHAHTSTDGAGNPLAWSCTEFDVLPPGSGSKDIEAEALRAY